MSTKHDVVIVGGGPAGSTAAIVLAKAGLDVCVLEKATHPRYHIGESILPRTTLLLQELGVEEIVKQLPHVPKYGAEFGFGNNFETRKFLFADGLIPSPPVFNVERALFDKAMLDQARSAGATVREQCPATTINRLSKEDVEIATRDSVVKGRMLLDASGQGTLVGRHLRTRRRFKKSHMQRVAYSQHFNNVERPVKNGSGHPAIIMCEEGWFWLIGLNKTKTSVGFVAHPSLAGSIGVNPTDLLQWAIARCPLVRHRMRDAEGSPKNIVLSDYSYNCWPYAGDGYFLIGDAACFLDPIFSTGVTFAMMSGAHAATDLVDVLNGTMDSRIAYRRHCRFIKRGTAPYWKLIQSYYQHSFRELFMSGGGPWQMPAAIISILAAQVFPQLPWKLRWRNAAFHYFVHIQKYWALAPRQPRFHLMNEQAIPPTLNSIDADMPICSEFKPSHDA
jgi:flavin-dependent dehydrogenase